MRVALFATILFIYSTLGLVRPLSNWLRDHNLLRLAVGISFALAATAMAWLIFRDPRNRAPKVVASLIVIAGLYGAAILPMSSPEEKIHFIEYGVVALLAEGSAPQRWSATKKYLGAALFVLAAGWGDELIQALLPSRYYDLRDVAFNAAAGVIALVALAAVRFSRRETPAPAV
ncbi:MAG TPA: VanZ family protein [Thermoanaerobaculia bacterium]